MRHATDTFKMHKVFSLLVLATAAVLASACSSQKFAIPDEGQSFNQVNTYNNKVDIVLMVDNSSSMLQYQTKLANEIPGMISYLDQLGMDYNVVVTTTDVRTGGNGSKFIGTPKVLNRSVPDMVNVLKNRILAGQTGSDLEQGLVSVMNALSPSYLSTQGAGFLRDDAMLVLIFLSNEDDYSAGTAQSYIDYFDKLKPPFSTGSKAWVANFLGVLDLSSQCTTTQDYKEPGLRYMGLADASGGIKGSICNTTLAQAVQNVQVRIIQLLTDFYLGRLPRPETIRVYVNGALVAQDATNGWSYDASKNMIRFNGKSIPGIHDSIRVDFTPAEAT